MAADLGQARCSGAMGFDHLLEAGEHVLGVVEHGLIGVERQVGQQGELGVASIVAEALRDRHGQG